MNKNDIQKYRTNNRSVNDTIETFLITRFIPKKGLQAHGFIDGVISYRYIPLDKAFKKVSP